MQMKLEDPRMFANLISIISELVTEVRIKVNEFGMSITAMDPANVAMVSFKVPKSAFSQFETGNEVLGVNLDNLKQILKRCSAGSSLLLERKDNFLREKSKGKNQWFFSNFNKQGQTSIYSST